MYPEVSPELSVVTEAGLAPVTFILLRSGLLVGDGGHGQLELLELHEVGPERERQGGHQTSHGDTEGTDGLGRLHLRS